MTFSSSVPAPPDWRHHTTACTGLRGRGIWLSRKTRGRRFTWSRRPMFLVGSAQQGRSDQPPLPPSAKPCAPSAAGRPNANCRSPDWPARRTSRPAHRGQRRGSAAVGEHLRQPARDSGHGANACSSVRPTGCKVLHTFPHPLCVNIRFKLD